MRRLSIQRKWLNAGPQRYSPVPLIDFLDKTQDDASWDSLGFRQRCNLDWHLAEWSKQDRDSPGLVDVARDPARPMESSISIGASRTLRTNCAALWILPPTAMIQTFGCRGRFLSSVEKCRLAGIVPSSMQALINNNSLAVDTAVGNCIPVPLVGSVMLPLLVMWQAGVRADLLESVEG